MEDEALIIKKAQEGDLDSFGELMRLYKKVIFNLCLRMLNDRNEAEDASQEAFIKIYRSLKTYNWKSKFSTWALKIASNTCIDLIRKRKIHTVPIDDYEIGDDLAVGNESSPEKQYMECESKKEIEAAVNDLPEKYRIMIIYYHFMNLSYQDICSILNEPMTIVKNRLYRARLMLRQKLIIREGGYDGLQQNI